MNSEKCTGTAEYHAFMLRILRSYANRARADEIDVTSLTQLRDLARELDAQTAEVCQALNANGFSWAMIGEALGMDRSNAAKRYGRKGVSG